MHPPVDVTSSENLQLIASTSAVSDTSCEHEDHLDPWAPSFTGRLRRWVGSNSFEGTQSTDPCVSSNNGFR